MVSGPKQDKTKIVQIWGEILDEGFTSVPNILLRYRSKIGLKPKHIMLIIDIMSYKWDAGYPFPSYSTLSQRSGVEERSVKRITQDLEELGLLVKTPRFDSDTGAQVTTVFDFRPLVKKLIEEMNRDRGLSENPINTGDIAGQNLLNIKKKVIARKTVKGDDKNVMGEGDKNVSRGVTELAPGGVTKMSPKEYTNNNKIISKGTPEQSSTYNKRKNGSEESNKKNKNGVSKDFREGIFRNRIFEIYDNLHDLKSAEELVEEGMKELISTYTVTIELPIGRKHLKDEEVIATEELVEEGAQRACKDLMVNRAKDLDDLGIKIDIKIAVNLIKNKFPYNKLPKNKTKARSFYTATICNLVAESVLDMV